MQFSLWPYMELCQALSLASLRLHEKGIYFYPFTIGYVFASVCWLVSLLAVITRKTNVWIFMKLCACVHVLISLGPRIK